ncbi:unnamed protein product, partial [Sphacelaria rigidula]
KSKTRGLVARIDRLEVRIEKQQKRDKKSRVLAAKAMLKRRSAAARQDGNPARAGRRIAHSDSADALRRSAVSQNKRLAIIRSNLKIKFSLHLQGSGRRVERRGQKGVSETDARMLISGELDTATEMSGDGNGGGGKAGAGASSRRPTRALIYTGDLGRYT